MTAVFKLSLNILDLVLVYTFHFIKDGNIRFSSALSKLYLDETVFNGVVQFQVYSVHHNRTLVFKSTLVNIA